MINEFKKELEKCDVIILDTCFAMNSGFVEFLDAIDMDLREQKKRILVNRYVMGELHRLLDCEDEDVRNKASKAVDKICTLDNIFKKYEGGLSDKFVARSFADNHIVGDVVNKIAFCNVIVLTCDEKLSRDILRQRKMESCTPKNVLVYRLNMNGTLEKFDRLNIAKQNQSYHEDILQVKECNRASGLIGFLYGVGVTFASGLLYKHKDSIFKTIKNIGSL